MFYGSRKVPFYVSLNGDNHLKSMRLIHFSDKILEKQLSKKETKTKRKGFNWCLSLIFVCFLLHFGGQNTFN